MRARWDLRPKSAQGLRQHRSNCRQMLSNCLGVRETAERQKAWDAYKSKGINARQVSASVGMSKFGISKKEVLSQVGEAKRGIGQNGRE